MKISLCETKSTSGLQDLEVGTFCHGHEPASPIAEHKYSYEKFIKEKRNQKAALPGRQNYFSAQRLVPQSFLPTNTEMIKKGRLRLAADWEVLVKSQENFSKKKWIASSDATRVLFSPRENGYSPQEIC